MTSSIRYLERKDIDGEKWVRCLREAGGLCYSDPDVLDALATQWGALVLGDYDAVMPLPWRRKYGIRYLYQPTFCQQLGVTGLSEEKGLADRFLSAIPSQFRYWDIQLNVNHAIREYPFCLRNNFLLSLDRPISALRANYHRNAVRNIRKAQNQQIEVVEDISASDIFAIHLPRFGDGSGIPASEYEGLEKLLHRWSACGRARLVGARDREGRLIASSGYLIYNNRLTFIINGNRAASLQTGATHLLKDYIIGKYAGTGYVLDFEGSDQPSFARFYQQFGAGLHERYPRVVVNRLPWPLNYFKRG